MRQRRAYVLDCFRRTLKRKYPHEDERARVENACSSRGGNSSLLPTLTFLRSIVLCPFLNLAAFEKVTKSSMDWETYKAAQGIEGEMEQATKDGKGYLNKQEFLQRCDVRKFETELEARQSKRDA